MSKFSLDYIEFTELSDSSVCATFHVKGSEYFDFMIPIIDDCKSHDMLCDLLGLIGKQCGEECHVRFYPNFNGFYLISGQHRLPLRFSSVYVDIKSVMYLLCKSYM